MPGRDILGNDGIRFAPRHRGIVCVYTGRDRRFVQEMQDQSIKRGSSVKEPATSGNQAAAFVAAAPEIAICLSNSRQ
jgi:hypothetical protein